MSKEKRQRLVPPVRGNYDVVPPMTKPGRHRKCKPGCSVVAKHPKTGKKVCIHCGEEQD